jgi:hypothetical protein
MIPVVRGPNQGVSKRLSRPTIAGICLRRPARLHGLHPHLSFGPGLEVYFVIDSADGALRPLVNDAHLFVAVSRTT